MFLRTATGAPGRGGGPASACRTPPSGKAPSAASPEATRPERRRNVRRSRPPLDWPASAAASLPRRASRSFLLISTASPPSLRILVDAVEARRLAALEIAEEPRGQRLDVLLEDALVASAPRCKLAACEPGHHLAQRRDVILRPVIALGARDAELGEIGAQPRQRPLVEE